MYYLSRRRLMASISFHSSPLVKTDRTPVFIHNIFFFISFHSQFFTHIPTILHSSNLGSQFLPLFAHERVSRATRILFLKVFILTRKATKGDFIATIEATLTNNRCASWRRKKKECTRKNGRIWKLFKNHNSGGGDYKHWQIIMALFHLSSTFVGLRIIRKGCVSLTTKKAERKFWVNSFSKLSTWESFFFSPF